MPKDRDLKGDVEEAARLRAAFAYADLSKPARSAVLGVSERQVTRIESAEARMPAGRWEAVVEATGIPPWFASTGFAVPPQPDDPVLEERVEALEHRIETITEAARTDALGLLEQALPDLVPALRRTLEEAPSPAPGRGRRGRAAGGGGA